MAPVIATMPKHSMIMSLCASAFLVVLFSCGSEATDTMQPSPTVKTAKIMPLGDSITESSDGLPTYRYYLWKSTLAKGYRIDFVGSKRGVLNGRPLHDDFDQDHEGHSGWRADEILAQIPQWARASSPDFVLLLAGHNDLCQGQDVASTVNDLAAIVDALRAVNGNVVVLVAALTASALPCHVQIPLLNAQLPAMVNAKSTPQSPVLLVDQYTGFTPATMTFDGVHPNAAGQSQIGERWFKDLAPLLDTFFAAAP